MKIRNGLVANSSSSSFILVFPSDAELPGAEMETLNDYDKNDPFYQWAIEKIKIDEKFIRSWVDMGCYESLNNHAEELGARIIWE